MKRACSLVCVILWFLLPAAGALGQACGQDWQWANPQPQGFTLHDVAWGNGTFVAIGEAGTILVSQDGQSWSVVQWGVFAKLSAVCFDGSQFIAVGEGGTMIASGDGTSWSSRSSGTSVGLHAIAHSPSAYVAVGYDWAPYPGQGVILASHDGLQWEEIAGGSNPFLFSVTWADSRFVATGQDIDSQDPVVLTSPDGEAWEEASPDPAVPLHRLAYGLGLIVAAGDTGLYTSSDAIHWTEQSIVFYWPVTFLDIAFSTQGFIAVGGPSSNSNGAIFTSPDGVTWTDRTPQGSLILNLEGVAYGGGRYAAVGIGGYSLVSEDASEWEPVWTSLEPWIWLREVAYGARHYVAVGSFSPCDDEAGILSSDDGTIWTVRLTTGCTALTGITYADGRFLAVGYPGKVFTSTDGAAWNEQTLELQASPYKVAYGNSRYVAVNGGSGILLSLDGTTWTERTLPGDIQLEEITYAASLFVAGGRDVSYKGVIMTSPDGSMWSRHDLGIPGGVTGVAFGSGRFVAVGYSVADETSLSATSLDGLTWIPQMVGTPELNSVAFGGGLFVALDGYAGIFTSADGVQWTCQKAGEPYLDSVCYGANRFVAVGPGNYALFSSCDFVPDPIVISGVSKKAPPFSLTLTGSNLQYGIQVFINGREWPKVQWNPPASLTLKGGGALKALFQKGVPTDMLLRNPDGGELSLAWTR